MRLSNEKLFLIVHYFLYVFLKSTHGVTTFLSSITQVGALSMKQLPMGKYEPEASELGHNESG